MLNYKNYLLNAPTQKARPDPISGPYLLTISLYVKGGLDKSSPYK
jgi:hypothetical protein